MIIIFIIVFIILFLAYVKFVKVLRCGNMMLFSGGIKTGKTTLAVRQAVQLYKSQCQKVWFFNYVARFVSYPFYAKSTKGKLKAKLPHPVLYSNIPLRKIKFVPVTTDLLERKVKPVPRSVCYLCEASLVADSMSYKNDLINEELLLFNKLWAHSSLGGYLIYDTQSIADNHYAVKRCLSSYFYIHHMIKVPFFCVMFLKEERFSDDNSSVQTTSNDVEVNLKIHFVPKSIWKYFDCYCYSVFTDSLPELNQTVFNPKSLKAEKIVSFKKYHTLKEFVQNDEKDP